MTADADDLDPEAFRVVLIGARHRSLRRVWFVGGYTLLLAGLAVSLLAIGFGGGRADLVGAFSVPLGIVAFWYPIKLIRAHVRFDFDGRALRVSNGVRTRSVPAGDVEGLGFGPEPGPYATPRVHVAGGGALALTALKRFRLGPLSNHAEVDARLEALRVELGEIGRRAAERGGA